MTITVSDTRSYPLVAYNTFSYADLTSGTGAALFALDQGAIVTGGVYMLDTVFNSGTSDVVEIGNSDDADAYIADADATGLVVTEFTITGVAVTNATRNVLIEWTGAGTAPTTGAGRVICEYVVPTKADENFE